MAVLFLDLDGFKSVNDSLGHKAGDELLRAVAGRLQASIKDGDTAARFGGDEFAIMLELPARGAVAPGAIAERLLAALSAPFEVGGRQVSVTASIGVATARGPGADLLRNADLAMYHAKAAGKNRYQVFEQSMHSVLVRRLIEHELEGAIERYELVLHYQPIVALSTGAPVAARRCCAGTIPITACCRRRSSSPSRRRPG